MNDSAAITAKVRNSCGGAKSTLSHWIELSDLNWWLLLVLFTLGALISAGTVYTSDLAQRTPTPYLYPLLWELTGYYTMFALLPLIVLGFSRVPIQRQNWYWSVPAHILLSVCFGAAHTLLMFGSRRLSYDLLGLGVYDYGHLGYRFLMEYHKQVLHYWGAYAVLRVLVHYRKSRQRERQAAALELETSELQRKLSDAQLQALRSQLNPHFLFNTLNMVSSVMYEDVERADRMLAALSRMLRMSLQENAGARVTVRRELEFLGCMVELLKARFEQRVAIEIHCPAEALECLVPNLLLHTFVENSIKHHDLARASTMQVEVDIQRAGSRLLLDVSDNGPGIADVEKAIGRGVGLSNTRQRLQGLYGAQHELRIANRPSGGLKVHVSIPAEVAASPGGKTPPAVAPPRLSVSEPGNPPQPLAPSAA